MPTSAMMIPVVMGLPLSSGGNSPSPPVDMDASLAAVGEAVAISCADGLGVIPPSSVVPALEAGVSLAAVVSAAVWGGVAIAVLSAAVGPGGRVSVGAPGGCVGARVVAVGVSLGATVGTVCAKAEPDQALPAPHRARMIGKLRRVKKRRYFIVTFGP